MLESIFHGMKFCEWRPEDFNGGNVYPVIIFIHGAGSRGNDISIIKNHSVIRKITQQTETKGIVFAPQCNSNTWFDEFNILLDFIRMVKSLKYVDQSKVNLVGVSMGGYATLQVLQSKPEWFSAAIVCCGGGMYWNAERLRNVPIRLFHGEKDTVVYPEESSRMYEKIRETGGKAELTIYPDCEHNCWDVTFQNEENIKWLLHQSKKEM